MADGPCFMSSFDNKSNEHRLRRQVGAPLWFSLTLPLKMDHE